MVELFLPEQKQRTPKREAERLKTLAESLMQGGKSRGNEMVSGIVVKQSPLEHLARGLQTAAGGYFAGQSQLKSDEDERVLQQRMADALGQWGNPQEAAAILAQDPRTAEMAFKLMQGETDWARQKELAQMRISAGSGGGNAPAPMQIANQMFELEQAMNNPNLPEDQRFLAERQYNLLGQAAKTYGFDRMLGYGGSMDGYSNVFGQQGVPPVQVDSMGNMQAPPRGQVPDGPLNPMQYQQMMQGQSGAGMDPVAAHAQAVAQQQQQIGVSPMQRPDLAQQPPHPTPMQPFAAPQIGEVPGYTNLMANRAAVKKGAEATAESDAKYMAEGRQRLPQAQRALQDAELSSQNIMRVVGQVRNDAQKAFTTGFTGSIAGSVAGSPAYDLKQNLDTLRANAAFGTLQNMRNNSPTGGALGAISEKELALLEAAFTNLNNSQSYDQFMQNLQAFETQNQASLGAMRRAYDEDYQRFGGQRDQFLPAPGMAAPAASQSQGVVNWEDLP